MTHYNFQNSATEYALNLINLHNYIFFILIVIFTIVTWLIYKIVRNFTLNFFNIENLNNLKANSFNSFNYNFFSKKNYLVSNIYITNLFEIVSKILLKNNLFYFLKQNNNTLVINNIYNLEDNLSVMFNPLINQLINNNLINFGFIFNTKIGVENLHLNNVIVKKLLNDNFLGSKLNNYIDYKYFHLISKNNLGFIFFENLRHATKLEIFWTILPTLILVLIALPSFNLLYSYDEPLNNPCVTLKAIGHQWYWSYEYTDFASDKIEFDSYMVGEGDLAFGQLRLLEVDNRVVLPVGVTVRVLITSTDVLHSWAVPSFAVKADAVPGRLNQVILLITRPGVFYGQCSELCGVQHGFMPIVVEAVKIEDYYQWINNMIS